MLDKGIVTGVLRHKSIDAFTDSHPAVEQMVSLLRPFQGKYTPVVADVLMDFILSKNWSAYQTQSIEAFCGRTYDIVERHLEQLPSRLHPRIERMLSHQWLESCKSRERMTQTFLMLSKRAAFENNIPDAMKAYDQHEEEMDRLFVAFFSDVRAYLTLQSVD